MDNPIIKENVNLAPFTTYKVGGNAKYYTEIKDKDSLMTSIEWGKQKKLDLFILAGGSNILINDKGVNGLVMHLKNMKYKIMDTRIDCESGCNFSQLVRIACDNSLTGLEWAIGIPGSLGGAMRGNAGAFNYSISENIETVEIYNIKHNKFEIISNKDCKFSYRNSTFKNDNKLIIWSATLKLKRRDKNQINVLISSNLNHRQNTQPKLPSAGCVFKNILFSKLAKTNQEFAKLALEENKVKSDKVPTGWLIEQLGLSGKKIGDAKISLEHANFIVNTGKAKAEDIVILISYIKQQVRDKIGIQLQEEIEYFGF